MSGAKPRALRVLRPGGSLGTSFMVALLFGGGSEVDRSRFSLCSPGSVEWCGPCDGPMFHPKKALSRAGFGPKSSVWRASLQTNTVFMVSAEIGGPPPFSQTTRSAHV
ncbi:hypothetical protein FQZ97_1048450 [compost metagenome]